MKQSDFIYNILNQKGIGRVKANKILQDCSSFFIDEFIDIKSITIKLENYFSSEQIDDIINTRNDYNLQTSTPNLYFVNRFQPNFPKLLNELNLNCPPIISCIGNIDLLNKEKVGFCGSRKASDKGIDVAKDISQQVALKDIVVVSGYASGIDQETHYWALKAGGSTIIVLPEGIQSFTIKRHVKDVWDWNRVLVISEFAPNEIWSVNRAMQRNTTIIALSNIMVLIEAKVTGGSIDAGYKTLQMNKPLFAPVYQGMPEEASGNQLLLSKGALPLMRKRETNKANIDKMMSLLNSNLEFKNTLFD